MASALDTIAHVVLPNLMKIKGASTLISAMERRDTAAFAEVWQKTAIEHTTQVSAKERNDMRFGVMSLPAPSEIGEAHMAAFVAKKNDAGAPRYFTLEYDWSVAAKAPKTVVCERESGRTIKHGDGPALTGDFQEDASAFVDAIIAIIAPA